MTTRRTAAATPALVTRTDSDLGASVLGQPVRITSEILGAAIARAQRQRALAFEETIGALWRVAPHRPTAPAAA